MDVTKLLYFHIKNENATLEITFDNGVKKTISIDASSTIDNLFLYFGAIDFVERYRNVSTSSDKEQDYGFTFFQNYRAADVYINNWGAKDLLYNRSSIIVDNTEKYYSLTPLKIKHIKCNRKINGIILVKKIY